MRLEDIKLKLVQQWSGYLDDEEFAVDGVERKRGSVEDAS